MKIKNLTNYCIYKNELSEKFQVEGIPTLVIVDGNSGEILNKDATFNVSDDGKLDSATFPWKN